MKTVKLFLKNCGIVVGFFLILALNLGAMILPMFNPWWFIGSIIFAVIEYGAFFTFPINKKE